MTLTYAYLEYTANSVNSIVVSVGRELLPSRFWAFLGEGRPIILRRNFSLLRSGVRKCSVQPWAFTMYVENLEMDNSLKCVLFIKVSGQITSNTLWK